MRRACLLLAALILLSSCSKNVPNEPAISSGIAEEITSAPETSAPPPTDTEEITDEVSCVTTEDTTEEATEEATEETTEETTIEITEPPAGIETLSAQDILLLTEQIENYYTSYVNLSHTTLETDILGSKSFTETESELRVNRDGASFRRGGRDGMEYLYLKSGELYYENEVGKCRVGGFDRDSFVSFVSDENMVYAFEGGDVNLDGEYVLLKFSNLSESGRREIESMLGLPEEYEISFDSATMNFKCDKKARFISSDMSVSLSVSLGGEILMTVLLSSSTEQTDVGKEFKIDFPSPDEYIFFTDMDSIPLYLSLSEKVGSFTQNRTVFEYSISDGMAISSDSLKISLSSDTVYAYNKKIGASIEKAVDNGDGTGVHTTLTHFNNRRGFSQLDGGNIFVDTTINAGNLDFTLSYPFSTSFFAIGYCTGMNRDLSSDGMIALNLNAKAAENIARNLLLRAGIYSSSPALSDVSAYTFIKYSSDGSILAVGYEFSAIAEVSGRNYNISRSIELNIISTEKANVKVIYIEVEDDEE